MAEFRLLGPVEVWSAGRPVDAGQPRQRCVLAALLVDAGRLVTWDSLVARVWGDEPPRGARNALYSHIARIRQMLRGLDDAGTPVVERRSAGYVMQVDPDVVDLHRFRRLVERARALEPSAPAQVALLRDALALWRGEPLAGVAGDWAARTREACHQQRLHAVVAWAEAETRAGNPIAVIEPVTALTDSYPLAEPLAAALMRGLHAAGHTAEALDFHRGMRERLAEELGTDPGAELQQLHHEILRGAVGPSSPGPVAPQHVPAQLPMEPPGFAGRQAELALLERLVAQAGTATTVTIAAVIGTAGVGKTALALHWAHRVAGAFPDGQLYVNMRGFDPSAPPMEPAEAVRGFLDALGVAPQRIPTTLAAQAALYRSLLAGRRILIVLDNARDPEQVRPLLPGTPQCFVVVTSRDQLTGLVTAEGAHPVTLDLLTREQARDLLHARSMSRLDDRETLDEVADACARLPLALVIVAARLATNPGLSLSEVAAELARHRGSLAEFTGRDAATDVRTVFSWSYRALGDAAARLFRLLGLHPGPDLTVDVAASLAQDTPSRARDLIRELANAHLVTEHRPGRFVLHDLLRAYTAELVGELESPAHRQAGVVRVVDHYLHTAFAADRRLHPRRDPIDLDPPSDGVHPPSIPDSAGAAHWFAAEHRVLLAVARLCADAGLDEHTWRLAWALSTFLDRQGHWHEWAATQQAALAAARRAGNAAGQIHSLRGLAAACVWLDRYDAAAEHLGEALELLIRLGDPVGQAHIHLDFTWMCERQSQPVDVLRHARRALTLYQKENHLGGQARALNTVGWAQALLGNHRVTLVHCGQALELFERLDDRAGEAHTWDSLGCAHHHLGDHGRAIACYQTAIDLFRALGERYYEADTLDSLGDTHHSHGDPVAARRAWQLAAEILTQLDHADAQQVRAKLDLPARVPQVPPRPRSLQTAADLTP